MAATTFEGIGEDGQIRLSGSVCLPDGAKVYVLIPDYEPEVIELLSRSGVARIPGFRVVYIEGAKRLEKVEMVED